MRNGSDTKASEINISDPALNLDDSKSAREIIKVDPEEQGEGIFETIAEAIEAAKPGSIIQIAEGHYCESLVIKTPNLIMEPIEEEGKVIILSSKKPCIRVFLDHEDKFEINRIRLMFKGPNKEATFTQKIDMNYENEGNEKCIQEFYINKSMQ